TALLLLSHLLFSALSTVAAIFELLYIGYILCNQSLIRIGAYLIDRTTAELKFTQ
ncbi:hypothetical protein ACJX0J_012859, partial [Zea mays]